MAVEEEEEEDGERLPPEGQSTIDVSADVAKFDDKEEKEEDDELAEYGLDKYDEEDTGESSCEQITSL